MTMEMPLVAILADMERIGIRIDRPYLEALGKEFRGLSDTLEQEIYALCRGNVQHQLAQTIGHVILFEKLQLPVIRKTKTGNSTDEEVLLKLSSQHPLPKKLIEFRELQKMHSTYIEGLLSGC